MSALKDVGLDVHKATIVVAVLNPALAATRQSLFETRERGRSTSTTSRSACRTRAFSATRRAGWVGPQPSLQDRLRAPVERPHARTDSGCLGGLRLAHLSRTRALRGQVGAVHSTLDSPCSV